MIGVLLVTHGNFSVELLRTSKLIIGSQKNVKALTLNHGDDIERIREEVGKEIINLNKGEGVIVLTDLFGGSPSNMAASKMRELDFQCLTGLNLPMLLECLTSRELYNVEELAQKCCEAAFEGIKNLRLILSPSN